jgi:hypothetical protein
MPYEYNEQEVDMAPREVRVGLKTPGQKMIRLVWAIEGLKSTSEVVETSRDLGQVYDDGPSVALEAAAIALGEVPDQGAAFGPAVRDPADRPPPGRVFESILTDIRDFLKLRFGAGGMADPDGTLAGRILSELHGESPRRQLMPDRPEMAIQYAISALDALSTDREEKTDIGAACLILSDLLSAASEAA